MTEPEAIKRFFEIKKVGGCQKYLVVEFWDGGETRGPFFSEQDALQAEESYAKKQGWSNLQKV